MKAALNVYKRRGETPLMSLTRLQAEHAILQGEPLTYAGRLDPLAEGVLVVLVGEEAKRKELYLELRKTYRMDVLFGFSTDTYDLAGKLTALAEDRAPMVPLIELLRSMQGTFLQDYPPYSSKPVNGKPLFQWARENRLDEISIPSHEITLYKVLLRHAETLSGEDIRDYIEASIPKIVGDFRQAEILSCWQENLRGRYGNLYDVATIEVECSSGTYMRSLAHDLGRALGIPALAYNIVRTQVGSYTISDSLTEGKPLPITLELVDGA